MLDSLINLIFSATAWPMKQPVPGSAFHLLLTLAGLTIVGKLAFFLSGNGREGKSKKRKIPPANVLFFCGILLLFSEMYKQGFLYFIVNGRQFNWWYFPFQLCSIPMYLCLLYPAVLHWKFVDCIPVFLQDFGLLGGIMALIVPDGFLWPYWTLTLHGFFWHFILVFLSLYCHWTGLSKGGFSCFSQCLLLYFFCAGIAVLLNTGVQIFVYPQGYADLFYINCFFPSEQPVFSEISAVMGNFWGHLAYILASCIGAGIIHLFCQYLSKPLCTHINN